MQKHKILLYKTSTCSWCLKTEEFFREHKIKYKSVDVSKDYQAAKEMIEKSEQQGVPVIDIDGNIVIGFDEPKIRKLLKL